MRVHYTIIQLHNGGWNYTITQWGLKLHNYTMVSEITQLHNGGWNYTIKQWGLKWQNYTMGAKMTELHNGAEIYQNHDIFFFINDNLSFWNLAILYSYHIFYSVQFTGTVCTVHVGVVKFTYS